MLYLFQYDTKNNVKPKEEKMDFVSLRSSFPNQDELKILLLLSEAPPVGGLFNGASPYMKWGQVST